MKNVIRKDTIPLILTPVQAGFPNAAEDVQETPLDLNALVIQHPAATFYMRVQGSSMEGAGIYDGDLIVVDKSLDPKLGDIVVAHLDGEFTLKRYDKVDGKYYLMPENDQYSPIEIGEDSDLNIWGVVTCSVRLHRTRSTK